MIINWPVQAFEKKEEDKNVLGRLLAKFYQTNRQTRNWEEEVGQKVWRWQCVAGEGKKVDNPRAILPTRGKARRD